MTPSPRIISQKRRERSVAKAGHEPHESKERLIIKGLGGTRGLKGSIAVRGAKNAALKILAAPFLFEDTLYTENIPRIEDIERMIAILEALGVSVSATSSKNGVPNANIVISLGFVDDKLLVAKRDALGDDFAAPMITRFEQSNLRFGLLLGCVVRGRKTGNAAANDQDLFSSCHRIFTGAGLSIFL